MLKGDWRIYITNRDIKEKGKLFLFHELCWNNRYSGVLLDDNICPDCKKEAPKQLQIIQRLYNT